MSRNKPTGPQKKGSVQEKMDWKALEIVHPDAAGIDVGGSEHWVAVSPDRDPELHQPWTCLYALACFNRRLRRPFSVSIVSQKCPTGFAEIVSDDFPVLHAHRILSLLLSTQQ